MPVPLQPSQDVQDTARPSFRGSVEGLSTMSCPKTADTHASRGGSAAVVQWVHRRVLADLLSIAGGQTPRHGQISRLSRPSWLHSRNWADAFRTEFPRARSSVLGTIPLCGGNLTEATPRSNFTRLSSCCDAPSAQELPTQSPTHSCVSAVFFDILHKNIRFVIIDLRDIAPFTRRRSQVRVLSRPPYISSR